MNFDGFVGKMYQLSDWFIRLVYLNILFIVFSLLGLIVFGLFPSLIAMFAVLRDWNHEIYEQSIIKHYFRYFRAEFFKGNIVGFILLVITFIFYVDIQFLISMQGKVYDLLLIFCIFLCFVYALYFMIFFPVYVHFELKPLQYFKQTAIILILNPLKVFMMFLIVIPLFILLFFVPVSIVFFAMSLFAFLMTVFSQPIFTKMIDLKKSLTSR